MATYNFSPDEFSSCFKINTVNICYKLEPGNTARWQTVTSDIFVLFGRMEFYLQGYSFLQNIQFLMKHLKPYLRKSIRPSVPNL